MKYLSFARIRTEIKRSASSPKVTALSMAMGVGLAFGPLPGLHILIGFVLARILRLNPIVMLLGIFFHNPWTMVPIHLTGLLLGDLLVYGHFESIAKFQAFPWHEIGFFNLFDRSFWLDNGPILRSFIKPFLLGSSLLGIATGLASYWFTFRLCITHNRG